jgi:hypothetical protein
MKQSESRAETSRNNRQHETALMTADPGWKKFGSGMGEKIRIRDKHPGFTTLDFSQISALKIPKSCTKYRLGLSSLIAKIRPFEPIEQLLDDEEGGLQEDPVAEQEVLDVVGIGGVGVLHPGLAFKNPPKKTPKKPTKKTH